MPHLDLDQVVGKLYQEMNFNLSLLSNMKIFFLTIFKKKKITEKLNFNYEVKIINCSACIWYCEPQSSVRLYALPQVRTHPKFLEFAGDG